MSDETRFLAIDYGKKRIGLALTDPLKIFAYPFETLANDINLLNNLQEIVKTKNIVKIILGYPLKESGEETILSKEIRTFKENLQKHLKIDIILWDERYTSSQALENIIESVTKKKKRKDKGLIDRNAAAVILSEYLNSNPK